MVEDWGKVNILKSEKRSLYHITWRMILFLVRKKRSVEYTVCRGEKRTLVRRKEKVTMVSGNKIMVDFYFLL